MWIFKLNSDGTGAWQRVYGPSSANSIQQTTDGGYIAAGFIWGGAGYTDFRVLKLDSNGFLVWQKTYGGTGDEIAYSISQTIDGGYIVAGHTGPPGDEAYDIWILKLDPEGTVTWQKTYGGVFNDEVNSIRQTSDGGYIVAGHTDISGTGNTELLVLKIGPNGDIGDQCGLISTSNLTTANSVYTFSDTDANVADAFVTGTDSFLTVTFNILTDTTYCSFVTCSFSITPASGTFTSEGGTDEISVEAPDGCDWTAASNVAWIAVTSGTNGSGDGTVSYTVESNTDTDTRTGTITVAGKIFTVTQTGVSQLWAKSYGGPSFDYANSIMQSPDGGYIAAGGTLSSGMGARDVCAMKLGPDGAIEWQKTYGMASDEYARVIRPTSDGGYIILAQIEEPAYEPVVLKLNHDGSVAWQKQYRGIAIISLEETSDGGYIMTGFAWVDDANDLCVLKLNTNGSITWSKTYGRILLSGPSIDEGTSIWQTADGGYIVAGRTPASFDTEISNLWVLRLDASGSIVWHRYYLSTTNSWAKTVRETSDGGFIVLGSMGIDELDSIWVVKLGPDGDVAWQKTFVSDSDSIPRSSLINQTQDGGYILTELTYAFGGGNFWVFKLNPDGVLDWQKTYGGVSTDIPNAISQTTDGGYILAGGTDSFGEGGFDLWVLKTGPDGEIGDSCDLVNSTFISPVDTSVLSFTSQAEQDLLSVQVVTGTFLENTGNLTDNTQCTSVSCNYSISPTSKSFGSGGGEDIVNVSTTESCNWTAVSNVDWITITSGNNGIGNGTVFYTVGPFLGEDERTGIMVIAGKLFTVTQLALADNTPPAATVVEPVCNSLQNNVPKISGTASDNESGVAKVELQITDGTRYVDDSEAFTLNPTWITATGTDTWFFDTPNVNWAVHIGTWTISVRATDLAGNQSIENCSFTFVTVASDTKLSINLSAQRILFGDTLDVSGKLTPQPDQGHSLAGFEIKVDVTSPSRSTTSTHLVNTNEFGQYTLTDITGFDEGGTWTIKVSFEGNNVYNSSDASTSLLVGESAGYAIIIQGKIPNGEGILSHNKTTNRIYDKFIERNFDADDIYYFNYDTSQPGVDELPTRERIKDIIETWARDKMNISPAPLFITATNHGDIKEFHIDNEVITPSELDDWLETMEGGLTSDAQEKKRIIILGYCYSGSFIPALSKPGRIIVASAAEDEESYKGPNEPDGIRSGEFFLEELFKELGRGFSLKGSFRNATDKTEEFTLSSTSTANAPNKYFDGSVQHSLLDDNNDGIGTNEVTDESDDGKMAADIIFGSGETYTNSGPNPADITAVTETKYLGTSESLAGMWATVNDDSRVDAIWFEVRSPATTLSTVGSGVSEQVELDLPRTFLEYNPLTSRYEADYAGFDNFGMWEVYYFVKDSITGEISPMVRSVVYKNKSGNNPPDAFNLISPEDGSKQNTMLIFEWGTSSDPDSDQITYNLLIATDAAFNNVVYMKEGIDTTAAILESSTILSDLTTYYWKVQAVDIYGSVTDSVQTWSFNTDNTNFGAGFIVGIVHSGLDYTPIEGATVSTNCGGVTEQSKDEGKYFIDVPSGICTVTSVYSGYFDAVVPDIFVDFAETTGLNIPMFPINTCNYTISPTETTFPPDGGADIVDVSAAITCDWTAVSNADWIIILSGSIGSGNGAVDYLVLPNNGTTSRDGTMTIAGEIFKVTQTAAGECISCGLSLDQDDFVEFSISNDCNAVPVELQLWIWIASTNEWILLLDIGSNGGIILPAGFSMDRQLAPANAVPAGSVVSVNVMDPVTKEILCNSNLGF